jgi:parallel beta-helix repeat protein
MGVYVWGFFGSKSYNNNITNCNFYNISGDAIVPAGDSYGTRVEGNLVSNSGGSGILVAYNNESSLINNTIINSNGI